MPTVGDDPGEGGAAAAGSVVAVVGATGAASPAGAAGPAGAAVVLVAGAAAPLHRSVPESVKRLPATGTKRQS